jgi:hypothetical protein
VLSQSPEAVQEVTFAVAHSTVVPGRIPAVAVLLESAKLIAAVAPVGVVTVPPLEELLDEPLLEEPPLEEPVVVDPELPEELLEPELLEPELELLDPELLPELPELEPLEPELLEPVLVEPELLEPLLLVGEPEPLEEPELLAELTVEVPPPLSVTLAPPPQPARMDTVANTTSNCFIGDDTPYRSSASLSKLDYCRKLSRNSDLHQQRSALTGLIGHVV